MSIALRKGSLDATKLRIAVVVSRFNSLVTDRLLTGTLKALAKHGCPEDNVVAYQVPGAVELPVVAAELVETGRYHAVVALGAVVRGETQHHHYISQAVVDSLQSIALQRRLPVILGVLTTENMEQALQRSGDDPGNKGYEAALTAIETANLLAEIRA